MATPPLIAVEELLVPIEGECPSGVNLAYEPEYDVIRAVPLTRGLGEHRYTFDHYKISRETDNLVKKNPERTKALLAEGRITGKTFDDQVAQTPRRFYETLVDDLKQAIAAFQAFDS